MAKLLKDVNVTAECEELENGKTVWFATSETLQGLFVEGDSYEDLCQNLMENIPLLVHELRLPTCNTGLMINVKRIDHFKVAA